MRRLLGLILGGTTVCVAWACGDNLPTTCAGTGKAGIIVDLLQPGGTSALPGATIIATDTRDNTFADTVGPVVQSFTAQLDGGVGAEARLAEFRGGDYVVEARKPYWTSATRSVHVPGDRCNWVETQHITMEIHMVAGAPPVRSLAVAPRAVPFGFCNDQIKAETWMDADPLISRAVTWLSLDTLVATVDVFGSIHGKSKGATMVIARSVADTAVTGAVEVRVEPVCP